MTYRKIISPDQAEGQVLIEFIPIRSCGWSESGFTYGSSMAGLISNYTCFGIVHVGLNAANAGQIRALDVRQIFTFETKA